MPLFFFPEAREIFGGETIQAGFSFTHTGTILYCTVLHWTGLDWTGLDRTGLYSTVQYHRTKNSLIFFSSFLFFSSFPLPQTLILAILYHTQSATLLSFIPIYSILFFSSSPSSSFSYISCRYLYLILLDESIKKKG